MTVATEQSSIVFTSIVDGVALNVPFPVQATTELKVRYGAADTLATLGTHYTVALVPPDYLTATVTPVTGFAALSGGTISVRREVPYTQPTDIPTLATLSSSRLEQMFDRIVFITQQLRDALASTLRFPTTDTAANIAALPTAAERASKYLGFDVNGKPIAIASTAGTGVGMTTFGTTWVQLVNALAGRSALDVYSKEEIEQLNLGGYVNALNYGVVGDGITDDTDAIQDLVDTGVNVLLPPPLNFYKVTSYIEMTTPGQVVFGVGDKSKIVLTRASGATACPVFWLRPAALAAKILSLCIDGNDTSYVAPIGGASIAFGDAIVVEASDAVIFDVFVKNCWNNGVGVGRFLSGNTGQVVGFPERVHVNTIRGYNNGKGTGTGGDGGATVDNLTGSKTIVANVTDNFSAYAVIEDYAGGASGLYSNISGQGNTSGTLYVGGTDSEWVNLRSSDSAGIGFWVDAYASHSTMSNFHIKACAEEGLRLQGCNNISFNNGRIMNSSYENPGSHPGVLLNTTSDDMPNVFLNNVTVDYVGTEYNSYGLQKTGSNALTGRASGRYGGLSGPYSGVPSSFLESGYTARTASGATLSSSFSTPMTITEGIQLFSTSYTASAAGRTVVIEVDVAAIGGTTASAAIGIFIDGATNCVTQADMRFTNVAFHEGPGRCVYFYTAGAGATAIAVRMAGNVTIGPQTLVIRELPH